MKNTPILRGKDAKRFMERMANPRKDSEKNNGTRLMYYDLTDFSR